MFRAVLVSAMLACCGLAFAQTVGDKKIDKGKTDKSVKEPKGKPPEKSQEPAPQPKIPLEEMRLPRDILIVVVDDLLKAQALIPKQWIVDLDEWRAQKKRLAALEQQLKMERVLSTCTLSGRLDGDFLYVDAQFVFATGAGKTTVPLALKEGFLVKDGLLDQQPAILDIDKDEGFVVRVEKEGNPHRLVLNLRVPVKKTPGGLERSIDLSLPAAAGIMLHLDLPVGVKELRCNGVAEKAKKPGHWEIGVERAKTLNLVWKEPAPPSANTPLVTVENQIKVDVDATHVNITTDVFLQDIRPRTEEWHLYLPPQAKVERVDGPKGMVGLAKLEEKTPYTILRVPPTSDRWQVTVSQRVPRPAPGARVPIGPFQVLGAFLQGGLPQPYGPALHHGTITVKMPGEASLGQRLVFTRFGKINQTKNGETEAAFQYVGPSANELNPKAPQPIKAPLELEWRFEKNQLRTEVEHLVKLKTLSDGYEIDIATQIRATALYATVGALDVRMPPMRPRGVGMFGASANLAFPGGLPWAGVASESFLPWTHANPDEVVALDKAGNPIQLIRQDAFGKTRVLWTGTPGKQATLELKNSYRLAGPSGPLRVELPRPLSTQDRSAKMTIQTDERIELLQGDGDEPAPERHRLEATFDQAPAGITLAWRPYQREIVTQATLDIDLHEHTAQVQQTLVFPRDRSAGPDAKAAHIVLRAPRVIDKVTPRGGEKIINHDRVRETLWVLPAADGGEMVELKLQYDLPIADKKLAVAALWPAHASQLDAKARVWTPAGVSVKLASESLPRGLWKERSIERIEDRDQFPALVLSGHGVELPLTLQIDDRAASSLAPFFADRALVQASVGEDGSQQVRARYWIRKINAPFVDVELPIALLRFREPPTILLEGHALTQRQMLDGAGKVMRVQLHPDLVKTPAMLDISYTIPPDALERGNVWSTTLQALVFRSDVVIGQMRWQLTTPTPVLAVLPGRNVQTETRWSLQGWLFAPETVAVDADAWLTGREAPAGAPVTFAFSQSNSELPTVYHLPRQGWLLGCSGIFLILTLSVLFSPLSRWMLWLVLALVAGIVATLTLWSPGVWPAVVFGLQPGVLLFLIFAVAHWLVQERYRRQLVFLGGFARPKAGSTITRTGSAKRPREASTVDAPPPILEAGSTAPPAGS